MASGTISLGTSGYMKGQIVWSATANGTSANNSTVTASIQVAKTNSYTTTGTFTGALNIGGTTKDFSWFGSINTSWVTLLSFTITKAHNSNGTGTCYISGQIKGPNQTTLAGKSVYSSSTVTLDTIPRAASLTSAPNFNDDGNPTIKYSNPAGNAVTSLQACISLTGAAADIAYRDISKTGSSYTFNLTDAERTVLRNATTSANSRTVRFYVKTVIGDATYTSYSQKTLSIVNANPTISPTIVDSNSTTIALTGNSANLIRYYSNAKITMGVSALKGATIKSKKVTNSGKSLTADGTISGVSNGSFTFTATDSRGNSTTKTVSSTLINYVELSCSLSNNRPGTDGNMTVKVTGNYFNGSFGSVSNTLAVYYRYKISGGTYGNWVAMTVTKSGNTYSATSSLSGLDYQTTYVFQAYAVDKLARVETKEKAIKTTPVFDWGEDDFNINGNLGFNGAGTVLRRNGDNGNIVLSAQDATDGVFIRPNGTGSSTGQSIFDKNGNLSITGTFKANGTEVSYAGHTHNYAASSHNHAASNITSGTLAIARGGTGVSAAKGDANTPVYLGSSGIAACSGTTIAYQSNTITTADTTLQTFTVPGIILAVIIRIKGADSAYCMDMILGRDAQNLIYYNYGRLNAATEQWPMRAYTSGSEVRIAKYSGSASITCYCTTLYVPN